MKQSIINLVKVATCLVICTCLSNCVFAIGGNTKNVPSTGQKLIDIKTAYDKGIITKSQYDTQKAAILADSSEED